MVEETSKRCCRCRKDYPLRFFGKNNKSKDGRLGSCLACNYERDEAAKIFYRAKQRGDIIPEPCEVCGSVDKIHGHHDDYRYPLSVRWLCNKHHSEYHRSIKQESKFYF